MKKTRKIQEISLVILMLSLGRIGMSIPNLEPIGAAALFGGALLTLRWLKFVIPFAALFIGDLILAAILPSYREHLFSVSFFTVYAAFGLTVLIGKYVIGKEAKMKNVVLGALLSSIAFFIITNFGSWLAFNTYPKTIGGLIACYEMGLMFYKNDVFGNFFLNSVIGNVFFSTLAFYGYSLYKKAVTRSSIA